VTVTCRYNGRRKRLLRRTVKLPKTIRGSGRCDTKPRVRVRRVS
jgi:hypothetical protein